MRLMKNGSLRALVFAGVVCGSLGAGPGPVEPFEIERGLVPANRVDSLVQAGLKKRGIEPAHLCSDAVFIRRVYLDVIGALPEPAQVEKFLQDKAPNKRAALIDALLEEPRYAEYWAMKWADLLRVKSEFPINLWPNAVQAYHRWIRDALLENKPYDQFVRELLTSSGSNFRVPPVNFYRAVQGRQPTAIAEAVALTFMGVRLERWPEERRSQMARFFSRIAYKATAEWKEEIVYLDPTPAGPLDAVFPDETVVRIEADQDPREVFAKWLITPTNPWFARNIVNRTWSWLLGRGIIHEPDDIRPDNPPVHPELLTFLEREFVKSRYDLKALYRLILNSRTYQQSSIPRSRHPEAVAFFACYPVRRLEAEVLLDALCQMLGGGQGYESAIPEPFSFIPDYQPAITLADGSISSPFLELFGRPARDTGLESERNNQPTDAQRLYLLNSSEIQRRLQNSQRLRRGLPGRKNPAAAIRQIYLLILSRYPTPAELAVVEAYFRGSGSRPDQALNDLAWALINSKEFLYRH